MREALVADRANSAFTKADIAIHFGINPDRGGSPPNESKATASRIATIGDLVQQIAIPFRVVQLASLRAMKTTDAIAMYINTFRIAITGAS